MTLTWRARPPLMSVAAALSAFLGGVSLVSASIVPEGRLPPGGMFQAGVPGGIPNDYKEFCDVTGSIPGSALKAKGDGVSDDSIAINAALSLCPPHHFVYLPAGSYRISTALLFPARPVVLRGAGSQLDPQRTNLLCYGNGQAVSMNGRLKPDGVVLNLRSGCERGSRTLAFSSLLDASVISKGDVLLVTEDDNADEATPIGGSLELSVGVFPSARFQWNPSRTSLGSYYVSAVGGSDPKIPAAKVRQVFYSAAAGTESILVPSDRFPLDARRWAFADQDSLGFQTLYVRLEGDQDPSSLAQPRTDGVPDGGVCYTPGISWGGIRTPPKGEYAHHGQPFKVVSRDGVLVTLDRPFYWSFKRAITTVHRFSPGGSRMGLEDLCIQVMQAAPNGDTVLVSNTLDSWVRNVEVKNSSRNFIQASGTMDCEFRHNYVHEPWDSQGGSGYGIRLLGWNANDLVEDNIAYSCRHSYVMDGINTGNVIGYNFSLDPNDNTHGTLHPEHLHGYLYQDFLTHGSSPRFCLFEGNVGAKAYCDFVHGNAEYLTYFRNRFRLHDGHILNYTFFLGSEVVDFDRWNNNMTVVGNILGYPAMREDLGSKMGPKLSYEGHNLAIYRLGYNADDSAGTVSDDMPKQTLLRTGNFDYLNGSVVWDPENPERRLPESYYLASKPDWFGDLAWPSVDPNSAPVTEAESHKATIPAMARFALIWAATGP